MKEIAGNRRLLSLSQSGDVSALEEALSEHLASSSSLLLSDIVHHKTGDGLLHVAARGGHVLYGEEGAPRVQQEFGHGEAEERRGYGHQQQLNIPFPGDLNIRGPQRLNFGGFRDVNIGGPRDLSLSLLRDASIRGPRDVSIGGLRDLNIGGPRELSFSLLRNPSIGLGPRDLKLSFLRDLSIGGPSRIKIGSCRACRSKGYH